MVLSLKTNDGMKTMKMDMSGAAAVLASHDGAQGICKCRSAVTGYMMCTDNMPSGSALNIGDVLTFRNGKTAEIHNTDAEGRLVLADGLVAGCRSQARRDRRHRHVDGRRHGRARSEDGRRLRQRPTVRRPGDCGVEGCRRAGVATAAGARAIGS